MMTTSIVAAIHKINKANIMKNKQILTAKKRVDKLLDDFPSFRGVIVIHKNKIYTFACVSLKLYALLSKKYQLTYFINKT